MLKKVLLSACLLLINGFFCIVYSQEATIKLDSEEQIKQFQEMFANEELGQQTDLNTGGNQERDLSDNSKEPAKKIESSEEEFEVYKPQAKEDSVKETVIPNVKPQPSEEEKEFKVFIPQAVVPQAEAVKEGSDDDNDRNNIKWLQSQEDLEEFEKLLKKAQFDLPVK